MEPAVRQDCLNRRTAPISCDFLFVVDDRPGLEPTAFQTVDRNGRPVVGFTLSLIAQTQNPDEIAFVVGHEAAHHILNHLDRKSGAATAAAVVLGSLASAYGGDTGAIARAQEIGASVGARYYSKDWELEADYLGAIIHAGMRAIDPIIGSGPVRAASPIPETTSWAPIRHARNAWRRSAARSPTCRRGASARAGGGVVPAPQRDNLRLQ